MGKQKPRTRALVQRDNYVSREAFLLCETTGCKNVVAAWVLDPGHSAPVRCASCRQTENR